MVSAPRACIKTVRLCVLAAEAYGLDRSQLLRDYGVSAESLTDPYARVPHAVVSRLWHEVPARTGDAAFGLHAAERWHAQSHDAFDSAIRHAETLGEMFGLLGRYVRLMHEAATIEIERAADEALICERFSPAAFIPPHFGELIMAMWVLRARQFTGSRLDLREVSFAHPAPAELGEHQRVFAVPLRFDAPAYSIRLGAACLDARVVGAEPMMGMVLERHLRDELARLPPTDDFLAAAEQAARAALSDPSIDIRQMARRLHTSDRTLQRRLRLLGTSFQELIEKARRDQAQRLLRDPRLTLSEIAFMTGYTEMSTFYRAFRRWTGKTPGEYRNPASG